MNTILIVLGWIVGGVVVVLGMRGQIQNQANEMKHLALEIALLRQTLVTISGRIDTSDKDLAYLRGLEDARSGKKI